MKKELLCILKKYETHPDFLGDIIEDVNQVGGMDDTVLQSAIVVVGAIPVVSTSLSNSTISTIFESVVANEAVSSSENFNFERLAT